VFENKVLRRILGRKRDTVMGGWRKLHNEELHYLYSPHIIRIIKSRRMRGEGHVARMGEKRTASKLLVGKSEGRRALGRLTRRWMNNIKMAPVQTGLSGVDWSGSGYVQVESSCERGNGPSGYIKGWETIEWMHNWWPLE
jgi:hypothetical protein